MALLTKGVGRVDSVAHLRVRWLGRKLVLALTRIVEEMHDPIHAADSELSGIGRPGVEHKNQNSLRFAKEGRGVGPLPVPQCPPRLCSDVLTREWTLPPIEMVLRVAIRGRVGFGKSFQFLTR